MLNFLYNFYYIMDYSQFQTGDILLFHNISNCKSCYRGVFSCFTDLIMCCSKSKYSHSAIVIRDPQFTNPPLKGLYVLESSYEAFRDAEDHKYKFGVELEEFNKVMNDARQHEEVYWRKLTCVRDKEFYDKLDNIHKNIHNKKYDCFPRDWLDAGLHKYKGNNKHRVSNFICSALVAYAYVEWGFLPNNTPWTLITPKMFGTEKREKNEYNLEFKNCFLDKEIRII
jgi:cell wall-associated NlpC family hydrolase